LTHGYTCQGKLLRQICCFQLRCFDLRGRALATVPDQLHSPLLTLVVAGQPLGVHALQPIVTGRLTVSGEITTKLDDSRRAASRLSLRPPLGNGARERGRVLRLHAG
jgi:hypothetical protein